MRKTMRKHPGRFIATLVFSALGLLMAGAANALDAADVIEMQRRAVAEEMIRTIILDSRLDTAPTAEELQTIMNNGATDELLDILFSPSAYGDALTQQAYYSVYAKGLVVPVPCSANGYCPEEDVFFHEEGVPPVVQYVEPEPTSVPTVYYYEDAPYEEYYDGYSYEKDDSFLSIFPLFLDLLSPLYESDEPDWNSDRGWENRDRDRDWDSPRRPAQRPEQRPDNRPDRQSRPNRQDNTLARPARPALEHPAAPTRPERPANTATARPERSAPPVARSASPAENPKRPSARPVRPAEKPADRPARPANRPENRARPPAAAVAWNARNLRPAAIKQNRCVPFPPLSSRRPKTNAAPEEMLGADGDNTYTRQRR